MPLTFFPIFLLKKYLELSPSRIGWKLVILRVVLAAGGKCYLKFPDLFFEPFPKEYGLNRETRRFMNIQFSVDKFHESNHTSCGKTFNSSEYVSLSDKNSQACEQVNAKLRTIATTCTFMNPDMFRRSISLYLSYQNTKNSE